MRSETKYLADIVNAARLAMGFTQGMTFEQFENDPKTHAATTYQIVIIGEACKQISANWRDQHPEIPWIGIGRMRDHLIHRYFNVDLEIVWDSVQNDVPVLYKHLLPHVSAFLADSTTTSDTKEST